MLRGYEDCGGELQCGRVFGLSLSAQVTWYVEGERGSLIACKKLFDETKTDKAERFRPAGVSRVAFRGWICFWSFKTGCISNYSKVLKAYGKT